MAMGVGRLQRAAMLGVSQKLKYTALEGRVLYWKYMAAGLIETHERLELGNKPLETHHAGKVLETYQTLGSDGEYLEVRFGYDSFTKRKCQEISWKSFSATTIRGDRWATHEYTIARPEQLDSSSPGPQRVVESHSVYVRELMGKRKRKLRGKLRRVQPVWGEESDVLHANQPHLLTPLKIPSPPISLHRCRGLARGASHMIEAFALD
eukprot:scaffold37054_cov30-Tisochrysis_lutea.AAC.2